MAKRILASRDVPWCLVFLVLASTTCNVLVLVGNYKTATSLEKIGQSTSGWSHIGIRISHSLQNELDVIMQNMSDKLIDAINHTLHTSKIFNAVVAFAGTTADHIEGSKAKKVVSFLQEHMAQVGAPLDLLPGFLNSAVDRMLDRLLTKAVDMLNLLLKKIKPVLEEVGKFMIKFGDKIQAVLEGFSLTLDNVQKLFDHIMGSISGVGIGEQGMLHETFNLFDVSNTGAVTKYDLKNVSKLYSISAFAGAKSDDLVKKYDKNMDGALSKAEFADLVRDPSLPNAMSVLLRQYSKKLVEVAGNAAAAKQRDEVAARVVDYLQLVVAKNKTKMQWIAQSLSNGSLPTAFTVDILAELALAADDPDVLTTEDVGLVVVEEMSRLNPKFVAKAYNMLSDSKRWVDEGYYPSDHAKVLKLVATWITSSANHAHVLLASVSPQSKVEFPASVQNQTVRQQPVMLADTDIVESMPRMAFELGQKNMKAHIENQDESLDRVYAHMFATKTSRTVLAHLLGSTLPTDDQDNEASKVVKSGQPAAQATLEFAQWLAANATATSRRFQQMCFNYSKQSSNAIDSFATQIQGMVKKMQGFIAMMLKYSTPDGIKLLESQVTRFSTNAANDVLKLIKSKVHRFVNKNVPLINKTIDKAVDTVGDKLGHSLATAIATPLGQALAPALSNVIAQLLHGNSSTSKEIAQDLAKILGDDITKMSGDMLGKALGVMLHDMINKALAKANAMLNKTIGNTHAHALLQEDLGHQVPLDEVLSMLNDHASLHLAPSTASSTLELNKQVDVALQDTQEVVAKAALSKMSQHGAWHASDEGQQLAEDDADSLQESKDFPGIDIATLSGVWTEVVAKLRSFTNILPQATKILKFARLEVSKLASHLDSLFEPFQIKGPEIFNDFSSTYRMVWTLYFSIFLPLNSMLLLYGFWAGGFFGGPGSRPEQEEDSDDNVLEQLNWRQKLYVCCDACCHNLHTCHDLSLSFWSFIIVAQLFVLLVFLVALLMIIIAALKFIITSGCQQIYVLGDPTICGEALKNIRKFLLTFLAEKAVNELPKTCMDEVLLTCAEIGTRMQTSAMLTTAFGFLAALFSFQMLVESAILHTRAVWRQRALLDDSTALDK